MLDSPSRATTPQVREAAERRPKTNHQRASAARKVNSRGMREVNRALVLDVIRSEPLTSRPELARRTALTRPTVGTIVDQLIQEGTVREVGVGPNRAGVGRKERLLKFNELSCGYLGIEFGVRILRVAVADGRGQIRHIEERPAIIGDPKRSVSAIKALARTALRRAPVRRAGIRAVGVTLPGLVSQETGTCVLAPNLGWRDFTFRAELKKQFRVPVIVHNIAQAAAIAEGKVGVAHGKRSFVWVYLGSGVGSGIVNDGELFLGNQGFSGEIGHCQVLTGSDNLCRCGRPGCLESVASGPAILDFVAKSAGAASRRSLVPQDTSASIGTRQRQALVDLVRVAEEGDMTARHAFERAGKYVGIGLSYLVNLLNPELIVLGGHVATAGPLLTESVRESLEARALAPSTTMVATSSLGETAGLAGAIFIAMQRTTQMPRVVSLSETATAC